jgi:hypothetical protein
MGTHHEHGRHSAQPGQGRDADRPLIDTAITGSHRFSGTASSVQGRTGINGL